MTDLLGPGAFGAANALPSRPAFTPDNAGADPDTWFGDCTDEEAEDGTEIRAAWLNKLKAALVSIVRRNALPESNLDDDLLTRAILSQRTNFAVAGGTANALTATLAPALTAYSAGLPLRLLIGGATNTASVTLNVNGLGALAVLRRGGGALEPGDLPAGSIVEVVHDGTQFRLVAPVASENPPGGIGEIPIGALPWPEVYTADRMVAVASGSKVGQGGYVTLAGGEVVTLGRATAGGLGVLRRAVMPAVDFGQANANHLAAGQTYYLRAYLDATYNLVPYLQRGSDADAIPGGWLGNPGAASGGGFDSSRFDILLARIVTGSAGSAPTVTRYRNAAILTVTDRRDTPTLNATHTGGVAWTSGEENVTISAAGTVTWRLAIALGWARKPVAVAVSGGYIVGSALQVQTLSGYGPYISNIDISRDRVRADGAADYAESAVWVSTALQWTSHGGYLAIAGQV